MLELIDILYVLYLIVSFHSQPKTAPNSPGCWMRFPSGCPKQENVDKYKNLQNPRHRDRTTYNGASNSRDKCYAREKPVNEWCGVSNVVVHYVSDN